jgi:predicted RecB family nuclease
MEMSSGSGRRLLPIRFVATNKVKEYDRLCAAFDALVLSQTLSVEIPTAKIVHGQKLTSVTVNAIAWKEAVAGKVDKITKLLSRSSPPDLVLNRHCSECEFRARCRQEALKADDLSLLPSITEKERDRYRSKGIFTVTQLSYTYRARRPRKRAKFPSKQRQSSLQALAIRDNSVYINGDSRLVHRGLRHTGTRGREGAA